MGRHIRHVRARSNEWVRIHRSRPGPQPNELVWLPWVLGSVLGLAGVWLLVQAAIFAAYWLAEHWQPFAVGLVAFGLVSLGLHLYARRR